MTTSVQKWGNSQGIRIPKYLLDNLNWTNNEQLVLSIEKNKIIIEKAETKKNIAELFDDFEGEYVSEKIDWGNPAGEEIW